MNTPRRLARGLGMLALALAALALVASLAQAQSTPLGRGVFSAFDVAWERIQRHNPWLQRIDNTDAKTWLCHGALTYGGGVAIDALTPASRRTALWIMAAFYVAREVYNVTAEGNRKYGDAFMDAAVPIGVAALRLRVDWRR